MSKALDFIAALVDVVENAPLRKQEANYGILRNLLNVIDMQSPPFSKTIHVRLLSSLHNKKWILRCSEQGFTNENVEVVIYAFRVEISKGWTEIIHTYLLQILLHLRNSNACLICIYLASNINPHRLLSWSRMHPHLFRLHSPPGPLYIISKLQSNVNKIVRGVRQSI